MVFLGQGPTGPIPTARPPYLSSPRTLPAASPGPGLGCPAASRRVGPGRHPDLGPLPLRLSLAPQARIPFTSASLAAGLSGFSRANCLLGREKPGLPVLWRGETWGRCWTGQGHRATSRCLAVAIPSRLRSSGGGALRVPALPQGAPMAGGGIFPRAGARQSKGLAMVRTTSPNLLFGPLPPAVSCLHCDADLRPPFVPEEEGSPWPLQPRPFLCVTLSEKWRDCAVS